MTDTITSHSCPDCSAMYRIERNPAHEGGFDSWEVYQTWTGDEYEISGGVDSEEEATAVVAHFAAFGSPGMHSYQWARAFVSVEAMLIDLRA